MLLDYVDKMDGVDLKSFVNIRDYDEKTPLMIASLKNHYPLIELLVHSGADVNMRDKDGGTAISVLIEISRSESSPIPNIEKSPEIYKVVRLLFLL